MAARSFCGQRCDAVVGAHKWAGAVWRLRALARRMPRGSVAIRGERSRRCLARHASAASRRRRSPGALGRGEAAPPAAYLTSTSSLGRRRCICTCGRGGTVWAAKCHLGLEIGILNGRAPRAPRARVAKTNAALTKSATPAHRARAAGLRGGQSNPRHQAACNGTPYAAQTLQKPRPRMSTQVTRIDPAVALVHGQVAVLGASRELASARTRRRPSMLIVDVDFSCRLNEPTYKPSRLFVSTRRLVPSTRPVDGSTFRVDRRRRPSTSTGGSRS